MGNPQEYPYPYPYPISPVAEAFPPLHPARYAALMARISRYGFRPPIIVWRGEIIHGVELLQAYVDAGVEPRFGLLPDDAEPVDVLAADAIPYQEMDDNQRGLAGYLLSQWSTRGRPRTEDEKSANLRITTQEEAAELFGISVRLVSYASQVLSDDSLAIPALRQAVREWRIKCSDAAKVVDRPVEVQERAVELVDRGEVKTAKRAVERVEREIAEAEEAAVLAEILALPLDETVTLHVAEIPDMLQLVPQGSLDAIVTHPPHSEEKLSMYSDLAEFAAHALKPTGCLIVVGQGILLPRMMEALAHPELRWMWEADLLFQGKPAGSGRPHHVRLHRRPVLVYGKKSFGLDPVDDLIEVPADDDQPHGVDRNETAMELILERFCRPGQVVCDPAMLDRAGTALAARKRGCTFVGAAEERSCRDRVHVRLALAEDHRDDPEGASETDVQ